MVRNIPRDVYKRQGYSSATSYNTITEVLLLLHAKVSATMQLEHIILLEDVYKRQLYPLAIQWADEFHRLHPEVDIDISAGGAGKGITAVSYTHLDVYKRQGLCLRANRWCRKQGRGR